VEQHQTAAEIRAQLVETRDRLTRELSTLEEPSGALGAYGGMNSRLLHAELRGELAEVEKGLARLDTAIDVGKDGGASRPTAPQVVAAPRTNLWPILAVAIVTAAALVLFFAGRLLGLR
jgi:hypothetical protein